MKPPLVSADFLPSDSVVNVPSIKPFDTQGVVSVARKHALIVTVEDHYVTGGLGSAVAETLAEADTSVQSRLIRLGIQDCFGESGEGFELYEKFGLSAQKITETVLKNL